MSATQQIQRQLIWDRLLAIVEEQAQVLMRTAFSTVVREAGDLSAGVFDARGRMLAQAVTGTPGHVNSMADSVGQFLDRMPASKWSPGDVMMTNDPWDGTGHLNDFTLVTPVFYQDKLVAFFASTSHIADVGGRGFGADAAEVFEEGLNVPICFLFRKGELDQTLMTLIRANVRDPDTAEGDLYSLSACNAAGASALLEMLQDHADVDLAEVADYILETSRQGMLSAVQELPAGEYRASMRIDGYDQPLQLQCCVTLSEDGVTIDFAGSAGRSAFGINVPLPYTKAYASFGVRCVVGKDIPNNAGSLSVIKVVAPEGSLLNAHRPAAVSARHAVGQMLPDVVLGALQRVLSEQVPAQGASCIWNPVLLGASSSQEGSNVQELAQPFVINPIFNGGTGARPNKDGLSATAFPSGVKTTPTEINELTAPLVFWRKELLPDSGGEGEYRGGLGQILEISHAQGGEFAISKMFDRVQHPAQGRNGGQPGGPGRVYLKSGRSLRAKGKEVVPAGENLVLETPGGGGYGDPQKRASDRREDDALQGYITPAED